MFLTCHRIVQELQLSLQGIVLLLYQQQVQGQPCGVWRVGILNRTGTWKRLVRAGLTIWCFGGIIAQSAKSLRLPAFKLLKGDLDHSVVLDLQHAFSVSA